MSYPLDWEAGTDISDDHTTFPSDHTQDPAIYEDNRTGM